MLVLHRLEVRAASRTVLRHASLTAEGSGVLFLVGPGRAGKSTLLSALAGHGSIAAYSGLATLRGMPVRELPRRCHVAQHVDLDPRLALVAQLTQRCGAQAASRVLARAAFQPADLASLPGSSRRRALAVLAALEVDAPLYLVDEPTAAMVHPDIELVRTRLRELARTACVVVATHNRQDCLALGGRTALLAGGTVQECACTETFFTAPTSEAAQTYVATGNCGTLPAHGHPAAPRDGIWWLVPGLLAGMSRPGLVCDAATQVLQLYDAGVRVIVGLEETVPGTVAQIRARGVEYHHVPIPDMAPPSFAQAITFCRLLEPAIRENRGIALHCRGGLGRTGTALAAVLVWLGDDAESAIQQVRAARPHAIQTVAQARFIRDFADRIRGWH